MSPPGLGGDRCWGGHSCTQHGVCVSTRPGITQHFRPQPDGSPDFQRPLHQLFLFRISRGCLLGVCLFPQHTVGIMASSILFFQG